MTARADVSRLRAVRVHVGAAEAMRSEAARSFDGAETGGILLGQVLWDELSADARHAGGAGPAAVRTPTFFLRDLGHAQRLAADAFRLDASEWIGEWHTHLSAPPVPSPRDLDTYFRLLSDNELGFRVFVAIILVPGTNGWGALLARAWACDTTGVYAVPIMAAASEVGQAATADHEDRM